MNKKQIKHIAIILDGNRRWAKANNLPIFAGHEKVVKENIVELVEACIARNIPYLTTWAFSTENWGRSKIEIDAIMNIFRDTLNNSMKEMHEKGVKINTIGELSRFPKDIQEKLEHWKKKTKNNSKVVYTIALNYGGRDEIIRAMRNMVLDFVRQNPKNIEEKISDIKQQELEQYLDTINMPDPDLIIRPGGEKRLSGFMPWQSVYAEYYFTDAMMPDFGEEELDKALKDFQQRQRRFGK